MNFDDSNSQTSSKAMSQSMKTPFLDMVAEREIGKPCAGASMMTLSVCQFTQSIPAFHQKIEGNIGLRGIKGIKLSNLDLSLTPLREPIPLSLFEESPLGAISRLRYRDSPTRAKKRRPKGPSNLNKVQTIGINAVKSIDEATGLLQAKPVTTRHSAGSPSPQSLLAPEEIKQDMQKLRDQVTILNNQQRKELSHRLHQTKTEQKPVNRMLGEIAGKIDEIRDLVYIPITTTTGCDHQTSPSASRQKEWNQKEPLEHHLSHMVVRPGEFSSSSPTVGLSRSNSDKSHTEISTSSAQSQSSVEGDELLVELLADTTSMKQEAHMAQEERAHLRGTRFLISEAFMPAREDSSSPRSTFTQDQTIIATNQWKLSNTKQMTQQLDLNRAPSPAERQTQMVEENPWTFPEEEGSDDIASLLDEWEHFQDSCPEVKLLTEGGCGEWKLFTEWEEYRRQNQKESTGLQFFLYCIKGLAKLYWSTVWPMLDPRTLQVEHDGPMPFWKACLLIVLAAPVVTVGFVAIVQGMRIVRLVAWLLDYADDGAAIWI